MPALAVLTEQLVAPVPGGTGRYTRELTAALAAAAPEGWRVEGRTAWRRDTGPAAIPGIRTRRLPLPRRALTLAWERGLPPRPRADSLHAPTPLAPDGAVVTVHDTVPYTHPETLTPRGVVWHRRMIERAVTRARAVVVPTHAVAEELARFAPGPAPVHVIGHGVTALPTADVDLGLPREYVLAVGTVEPRKGLDVLVEAMPAVGLPLVVAGPPGWGNVDLRALAARSGAEVHVLGRVTDAELGAALRGAAVLAVPSRAEGFGLPLLEAMAEGVPVVHSDAPALVEVAAGTGVVARRDDPHDLARAVRAALESPDERVTRARARAAEFTWARAAARVWAVHLE
ncbi:glycosyltransferase family 1 protein [Actinokineospora sp. UTMC 2448]|uniref:glycosyltransferase family 4 protein n=1 Tax=Actinokineospora sp. UTMC 2448 TaxID=2268449 RepID=UPI002164C6B9|nr:glycosyltransferase family 1 protein [Actinokineospora sp. UTMC 2448]UVS81765.1 GDP-mannose-dependent alpha-(1-2)-phosphatidylinositol mannosyltransferase [Actinokineospora sp. UTMC 2448]